MKIKNVRVYGRDLGTIRPYTIAYKTISEVMNAFVEIEIENGIIGMGASNSSKMVVGQSVEETIKHLNDVDFSYLIGQRITQVEGLLRETHAKFITLPGTHAAIDIALHDAFTQFLKIPLVNYFGQQQQALSTSITIGIKNVEETLSEAEEYYRMGFRFLKIKTGLNPELDSERVIKIAERMPDVVLRVDANQGYNTLDLNEFVKRTAKIKLELIEQPFSTENFIKCVNELDPSIAQFVVADESLRNPKDALQLLKEASGCKIFNIKLMKTGGLLVAKQIAYIAENSKVKLMWGCNDESVVSIAAALHLALSSRSTKFLDLDGSLDLIKDVVTGGFVISKGKMSLTGENGLGIQKKD
ncbi:MAG: dipeptide epimerase [Flammeovirgaceae bacterium]|nr:dipeptide epimerase [Flammeovirgaceae bacterium]